MISIKKTKKNNLDQEGKVNIAHNKERETSKCR